MEETRDRPVLEARIRLALTGHATVVSISGAVHALLGLNPEDLLEDRISLADLVHPDDMDVLDSLYTQATQKPSGTFNIRMRQADGRIRCLKGHYQQAAASDGLGGELELVLQDAKSLHREVGSPDLMAYVRAMMENTDDFIYFKDRNHVFTGASQTLVAITSAADHWTELLGQTDYDVFPEQYADIYYRLEKQVFAGIPVAREIQEYLANDGSKGWVDNRKYPIKDDRGEIIGLFGIARDITEGLKQQRALRESEERFRTLFEQVPTISVQGYDRDRRVIFWNPASETLYGYSKEQALGRQLEDLIIPEAMRASVVQLTSAWAAGGPSIPATELTLQHADGSPVEVYSCHVMLHNTQGEPEMYCLDIDLSERKRAEASLRESEERLRLALAASNQAWFDVELPSGKVAVSAEYPGMIGYAPEDFHTDLNTWIEHVHPEDRAAVLAAFEACTRNGGPYTMEYRRQTKSGDWKWIRSIGKIAGWDAAGRATRMIGIHADITQLKEHEQQLEHIAHYDALTGLPNRVLLSDRLHQAMAQANRRNQKLAVAYIDLDGFKAINDLHGHAAGDQLLLAVATSMKQSLREGDTLARLGGDEFIAVLIDLSDVETSLPMLARLLDAVSQPIRVGSQLLQVSASIGVTFYPQTDEVDADQLLRQADLAMYQSKLTGKNRFHIFDAEEDRSVRSHHESVERIRLALARHEFILLFQPKVNMRTGAVIGAEALIRWQHPERGLLLPALFLPEIEHHPLTVELGEWVIDTALGQVERWQAAGFDIPVCVNISARHLQQADFVERLRGLLAAHPSVQPSRLELEVLETTALEDLAQVSRVLMDCREIGVMFALDDFGTGYSSLTYLKRLPVAHIKIDQSFVRDMLDDPDDLAILEGVLGLAKAFRREVVAEGVETVEHGIMLLQLGCELAQGYGIGLPMAGAELRGWAQAWRPDPIWAATRTLNPAKLPLLYAGVEHRAWIVAIEASLRNERPAPKLPDPSQCRLATWLANEGRKGKPIPASLQAITTLHQRVYDLAAEISSLQASGDHATGLIRLAELKRHRDDLLDRLQTWMQANPN